MTIALVAYRTPVTTLGLKTSCDTPLLKTTHDMNTRNVRAMYENKSFKVVGKPTTVGLEHTGPGSGGESNLSRAQPCAVSFVGFDNLGHSNIHAACRNLMILNLWLL